MSARRALESTPVAAETSSRFASPAVIGVLCGVGASVCWAAGLVAARHGVAVGLTPADLAFHRYVWAGVLLLPFALPSGLGEIHRVGGRRALVLLVLGGPPLAIVSYTGFILAPLGHGAVVQPAAATVGRLLLASAILREPLTWRRIGGALAIGAGLVLLAAEALTAIGGAAGLGDVMFASAGLMWASFGILVRLWSVPARRSALVVCQLSVLAYAPFHALAFGFTSMAGAGWRENLIQVAVQAGLAGGLAINLYARAAIALGAGRAAVFTALVPPLTVLIGFLALGEVPTALQLAGLVVVVLGFRFALGR